MAQSAMDACNRPAGLPAYSADRPSSRATAAVLTMKRRNGGQLCTRGSKIVVHFLANAVHEWNSKQPKPFSERFVDFAHSRYAN